MHVDGKCHCGHVTYRAEVDPELVTLCNCTDCQILSGSPFRWSVPTRSGTFQLLSGSLKSYVKTGESGAQRVQTFCPECGAPIYSAPTDPNPKVHILRVGSIVQRDQVLPKRRIWTRSAVSWLSGIMALPGVDKQSSTLWTSDPQAKR